MRSEKETRSLGACARCVTLFGWIVPELLVRTCERAARMTSEYPQGSVQTQPVLKGKKYYDFNALIVALYFQDF